MIREIDIKNDLDSVGRLVDLGFSDKLKNEGMLVKEEIRLYKKLYPFYWLVSRVGGRLFKRYRFLFNGFLCQEEGKVTGMVTIKKKGVDFKRWEINNVVIHPDYRGRGIARDLVKKAIKFAKGVGGELCLLKVRSDNLAAIGLYRSLGFNNYNQSITLKYEGETKLIESRQLENGYDLSPLTPVDSEKIYHLMKKVVPESLQKIIPLGIDDYRTNVFLRTLSCVLLKVVEFIGKARAYHYKIEKDSRVVGLLQLTFHLNKSFHRLSLAIHPDHQKLLTDFLILRAFGLVASSGPQNILISLNEYEQIIMEKCKNYGFKDIEREYEMCLSL